MMRNFIVWESACVGRRGRERQHMRLAVLLALVTNTSSSSSLEPLLLPLNMNQTRPHTEAAVLPRPTSRLILPFPFLPGPSPAPGFILSKRRSPSTLSGTTSASSTPSSTALRSHSRSGDESLAGVANRTSHSMHALSILLRRTARASCTPPHRTRGSSLASVILSSKVSIVCLFHSII